MKKLTLITTALVLSGSIFSVAQGAQPSDVPTAVVNVGDLDTPGSFGKEKLYRRLTRAARTVCRSLDPSDSAAKVPVTVLYNACIHQAVRGAVAQINRADFTDYVVAQTHKSGGANIQLASQ